MASWCILCDLVHFSRFGTLYQEKSGNPVFKQEMLTFEIKTTDGTGAFFHLQKDH
jgi:hypothetical protein